MKKLVGLLVMGTVLSAPLAARAQSDDTDASAVSVTVGAFYNVTSSGAANLNVGQLSWNDESFNFIGAGSPDFGSITIVTNTAWGIRCRLNANMPTSPGDGYLLKVDDNRGNFDNSGWSAPLSTADVELDFINEGDGTDGSVYNLDWRIEGLTSSDGKDPISRVATFTIYGANIV